jgi:glycosyltransferase involved in cell wall biosynthesis
MTQDKHKFLLTIAIPTFNRNKILLENLRRILPEMEDWVELLIVDNESTIPVSKTVNSLLASYSNIKSRVIRNQNNIGGNSNFLRCIEYCDTDYIWILGDDDYPEKRFLEKIKSYLVRESPLWINFYSDDICQPKRIGEIVVSNIDDYLASFYSISELVFVSTNIYKTSILKKGLEFGYSYQETMAPHLVTMLSGLENSKENGHFYITTSSLFESVGNNEDSSVTWPLYRGFTGIFGLYKIPFQAHITAALIRLIQGSRDKWLSNRNLIKGFAQLSRKTGVSNSLRETLEFTVSLIFIDKIKATFSIPLYFMSIFLGRHILRLIEYKQRYK